MVVSVNWWRFNSTMVRLKFFDNEPTLSREFVFQFHYGSIKIKKPALHVCLFSWFQFHYGSIKIAYSVRSMSLALLFQFHYGSIKIFRCQFSP